MTKSTHNDVWDLIPWYVNGTLDPQEQKLVEEQMAQDDAIAREVALQRRMKQAVANVDIGAHQTERSWSQLEDQLSSCHAWSWMSVPRLQFFVIPAALTAVVALVVAVSYQTPSSNEFETLTTEDPTSITSEANLRIKLAPEADLAHVEDLLRAAGVRQLGPVSETGLIYGFTDVSDLQALASELQNDPTIAFVAGDF
ncbi:MAG: hypothetical protein AAF678_02105 [Pseudomonadota bacterium]